VHARLLAPSGHIGAAGTVKGRDPIREHHIRPLTGILDRRKQREMWAPLTAMLADIEKSA
jgi:hypothetical protein